ncbi:hypothetical protein TsFJ059_008941 [Trichoderma semiorbis]|uniref:Succinate-semialdehyde dehydrogenase, mitochondrial n=1 Tax=Trichoderma semiorbis TaxID=1491008 RepID=A0A9P8HAH7_9HYPO|nr:hypothetical protein TsFJ059_008941 [Trichoderma semiorbis]
MVPATEFDMASKLKNKTLFKEACFVNGDFISAKAGNLFSVTDPATQKIIGKCPEFSKADTEKAIEAAAAAFPGFKTLTGRERARLLRKWFQLILDNIDDLALLLTLENGKTITEAKGEIGFAASFVEYYSEEAVRIYGDTIPASVDGKKILTLKEPIGVCALITPWNFPSAMITRKAAPALAAGCTVVIKVPGETPFSGLALAELARQAGFPKGVINVITALDNTVEVGSILTHSPLVQKVSFTGSTAVGKLLMEQASSTMKRVSFELGGNAPLIVFDDADVDQAVEEAIASKFRSSGQSCVCANRLYVHESIHDEFVRKYAAVVRRFKVGSGLDGSVSHGPLIHERAAQKVHSHVLDAVGKGAKVIVGGALVPSLGQSFYLPTVLTGMKANMLLAQEETFGPVAGIFSFNSDQQVVSLANDSDVGLAAYLFGKDVSRLWRVAEALQVGMVGINTGIISDNAAPSKNIAATGLDALRAAKEKNDVMKLSARTRLETVEQGGLIREQIRDGVNSTSDQSAPTPTLQSPSDRAGLSLTEDLDLTRLVDDEDLSDHRPGLARGNSPKDSQTVDEIEILSPKTDAAHESPARFSFFPYVLEQGQSSHIDYYRSNVISATSIILDEDTGLHQLIPKAFSAKHLMSALLAYSMAHRAQIPGDVALAESYRQQATTQYGKAIMALRSALSRKDDDFESLITSTLLLAATETTMGGVSDWYNHCIGANQLVRAFTTNINVEHVAYHRFLIRYLMYHDVLGAVTMRQAPILDSSFYKREIAGLVSDSTHPMVGANAKILSLMAKVCQLHEEAMKERAKSEEDDLNLALIYGNEIRDMASASSCCHNGDDRGGSSDLPAPEQRPLGSILPEEIRQTSSLIRAQFTPGTAFAFRVISLVEPRKAELKPHLEALRRGIGRPDTPFPARITFAHYYVAGPKDFYRAYVDVSGKSAKLIVNEKLDAKRHAISDPAEMMRAEKACLNDPLIVKQISQLSLPSGSQVMIDPWTYATDEKLDVEKRTLICYFYLKGNASEVDANHYAYPLDFYCHFDMVNLKVVKLFRLPKKDFEHEVEIKQNEVQSAAAAPWGTVSLDRQNEYHPDLRSGPKKIPTPLRVVQPDGPSFRITGNVVEWMGWKFHVGFNYREGMTLHNITLDGRNTFYRLALSEMFVPYADPRAPYHRKAAFDLGSNGAGVCANNLALGCDCLGLIKYFDAHLTDINGNPRVMKNVICCHEVDDGLLWKHLNFRTQKAALVRSRTLVLQSIITVSNYEYILAFIFDTAGAIHYEVRATGIVSTVPIEQGVKSSAHGTVVADGAMAPYHQHFFNLRIDPAIDGHENSVVVEETVPLPINEGNPQGIGYHVKQEVIEKEGFADIDPLKNRVFKIINPSSRNPVNDKPVAYAVVPFNSQLILANPNSFHARRSEFALHSMWFTKYHDDELYASGEWTNQSAGDEGILTWIKGRNEEIDNGDVVVWHTFGTTHNPRVEDWPVMPVDKLQVTLKPVNFFPRNPAIDLPMSTQKDNDSKLYSRM